LTLVNETQIAWDYKPGLRQLSVEKKKLDAMEEDYLKLARNPEL
jgi:hypothetical protein